MSEEEKKAIEVLKSKRASEQLMISGKMCVDILLNLIEKLQNQNQEYGKALEEWINGERVSFYCVHKKEIQNIIHNLNNDIDYWRSDCLRDLEKLLK